jgi:hypothetical protein
MADTTDKGSLAKTVGGGDWICCLITYAVAHCTSSCNSECSDPASIISNILSCIYLSESNNVTYRDEIPKLVFLGSE